MEFARIGRTAPALHVSLEAGETVQALEGSMFSVSPTVAVQVDGRKAADGNPLPTQKITATDEDAAVFLAPKEPGDILLVDVGSSEGCVFKHESFLAADYGVELRLTEVLDPVTKRTSFVASAQGDGYLALSGPGDLVGMLVPEEGLLVEPDHLIAWEPHLSLEYVTANVEREGLGFFKNARAPSRATSVLLAINGEGFVCISTRKPEAATDDDDAYAPSASIREGQFDHAATVADSKHRTYGNLTGIALI